MVHSDNKGLVLPPFVANTQFVIIPILGEGTDKAQMIDKVDEIAA